MIARSDESRSQEQARAKKEMNDANERHQEEVFNLREKIKQLVGADARRQCFPEA